MVDSTEIPEMKRARDWTMWIVLVVAAVVLVGRGMLISSAHSETWDDQYHIIRGERFLWMDQRGIWMMSPPLGEGIIALPVTVTRIIFGSWEQAADQVRGDAGLREHPLAPETVLMLVGVWNALLFLPMIGIAYRWAGELYGRGGGYLASALILIDPNFAAHIPVAAVDSLGTVTTVLACYLAWRYTQTPTPARLVALSAATAAAMLVKHTVIILPIVVVFILCVLLKPNATESAGKGAFRQRLQPIAGGAVLVAFFIWAMTMFDVSEPRKFGRVFEAEYTEEFSFKGDLLNGSMMNRWPAGIYLGSVAEAISYSESGHTALLLGEVSINGWWYYYPVVASYKIPIGIGTIFVLAIVSFAWRRWRRDEWAVVIPMLAWTLFLMSSTINIGFRHFLPAYAFMLIFAARAIADGKRWTQFVSIAAVLATAAHAVAFHPNYLSYVNWHRDRAFLDISDSNVDWGQSLKQVRQWLDEHPQAGPVYLGYFGERTGSAVRHYLGNRVEILDSADPAPERGTLILSPVWLAGGSEAGERYAHLRNRPPDAVIGDCMMVYKLHPL